MGFGKIQCVSSVVFSRNLKTTSARGGVIAAIRLVTYANTLPSRIEVVPKNWTGFLSMNILSERTTKDVEKKTLVQRGVQGKSSHGSVERTRTD